MDFLIIFGSAIVICSLSASASKLFSGKISTDMRICSLWISNSLSISHTRNTEWISKYFIGLYLNYATFLHQQVG